MKTIIAVFKKEIKRFFTDPRMIMGIVLPGLLLFVIYSLMGNVMSDMTNPTESDYTICIENEPEEFEGLYEGFGKSVLIYEPESKEIALKMLEDNTIDLYVVYEEDFYNKAVNGNSEKLPNVAIYFNSSDVNSSVAYDYTVNILNAFEDQLVNAFNVNDDINENYDVAQDTDVASQMIGMVLPFLLVVLLFSGAMGVCSDAIAGEKERGTIATLLVTPVRRRDLVVGKILALGVTTIVSATSSFLGVILSIPKLVGSEFSFDTFSVGTLALVFFVVVITALLFTSILTIISTYAKTVKEANGIAAPLMMLISIVGVTGMFSTGANENLFMYLIPVYNSIQCFTGILSFSFNTIAFLITIGINLVYISLCIVVITKMFNSERVMFNK
jgi:sodium transport system permease protein